MTHEEALVRGERVALEVLEISQLKRFFEIHLRSTLPFKHLDSCLIAIDLICITMIRAIITGTCAIAAPATAERITAKRRRREA